MNRLPEEIGLPRGSSGPELAPPPVWERTGLAALVLILLSVPVYLVRSAWQIRPPAGREAVRFAGSERCRPCHGKAWAAWQESHHAKAMLAATSQTVRGDFNNAVFAGDGITARFYRRRRQFFVRTEGPDGRPAEYEIRYTFGWFPLQQYLIPFPGGRFQCFSVAWDVEAGKWFSLQPGQRTRPGDWLHWTGQAANWNSMCADCHSTGVRKRYDPGTQTYRTTWTDINVGCETCHGPGSRHVDWASQPPMARPPAENFELTVRTRDLTNRQLVELCAFCHSRRSSLGDHDPAGQLLDNMRPELLREGLYHPDGQMLDEVYEYGSFTQSKMYHHNVRCSDCHDVHSIKRRKPGNALCLQCHRADTYGTPAHHFHKMEADGRPGPGALCERCHMPGRYYMVNDWRLDHSLRVPRPDLSPESGTPDACNTAGCHPGLSVDRVRQAFTKWYGLTRKPHYGQVLAAGRACQPGAGPMLAELARDRLQPVLVRATALDLLRSCPGSASEAVWRESLGDEEPLIRQVAAASLEELPAKRRLAWLFPLLRDPVRAVRLEATRLLAAVPAGAWPPAGRSGFSGNLEELRSVLNYQSDFPQGRHNLGALLADLGQPAAAETQYRLAIAFDPLFYPARMNLSVLLSGAGRNAEAGEQLRTVLRDYPENGAAAYSLGLLLAEENRPDEAEVWLRQAAERLPGQPRVNYNLGLLLQARGKMSEAGTALLAALCQEPDNGDFLFAAATHYLRRRQWTRAENFAGRLAKLFPDDPRGPALLAEIRRQSGPGRP